MKTIIFALLLSFSTQTFADPWTTGGTYRETAFQVLNVIDWGKLNATVGNASIGIKVSF